MVDDENVGENFANGTGKVDENGCCKVPAVPGNEVDCFVEAFEEDKKHETDLDDELRAPKKTKCLVDETCSVQHNNGLLQCFPWIPPVGFCIWGALIYLVYCDRPNSRRGRRIQTM